MGIPGHKYCLPPLLFGSKLHNYPSQSYHSSSILNSDKHPFPIPSFPSSLLTTIHSDRIITTIFSRVQGRDEKKEMLVSSVTTSRQVISPKQIRIAIHIIALSGTKILNKQTKSTYIIQIISKSHWLPKCFLFPCQPQASPSAPPRKLANSPFVSFLDALASLDFKLSLSQSFTFFTASASTGLSELLLYKLVRPPPPASLKI